MEILILHNKLSYKLLYTFKSRNLIMKKMIPYNDLGSNLYRNVKFPKS